MIGRVLLVGLTLCAAAEQGKGAEAAPQMTISGRSSVTVPLTSSPNGTLFLDAKIQGQPVTLLLDTGATAILDTGAATKLGLECQPTQEAGYGMIGSVDQARATTINLELGGLSVWQLRATCLDLARLRGAFKQNGMPAPDGVLSAEVMMLLRARIDFEKRTLELRLPTRGSVAAGQRQQESARP